ncbi:hypothetical protein KIN20_028371 [Parelaphostrongylus tenuis]|uniref:Uncharacterized protein n=1 Tax=Parelaphostrongylus tenuis TaxID=148309 RepID=A0AAD5R164_PARTN|nr:hypothetical protein KIN20_028371 [Parelaphostrongylus tenuis]
MPRAEGSIRPSQSCGPSSFRQHVLHPGSLETVRVPRPGCVEGMLMPAPHVTVPKYCSSSSQAVQMWSAGTTVQKCLPADPCPGPEHFPVPLGGVQVEGGHENARDQTHSGCPSLPPRPRVLKVNPEVAARGRGKTAGGTVPLALLDHSADIIKLDSREMTRSGDRKRAPVFHLWDWKEGGPGADQEKEDEAHPVPGAVPSWGHVGHLSRQSAWNQPSSSHPHGPRCQQESRQAPGPVRPVIRD